jgi:hypothetical protein
MLTESILQFVLEILRMLLIEATCLHVHRGAGYFRHRRRSRKVQEHVQWRVNARVRVRLIQRLITEQDQ